MSSLLGSIFGEEKGKTDEGPLSNVFDKSTSLPDRPHHKAPPPLPPRKRDEEKAEEQSLKKKRKRQDKPEVRPKTVKVGDNEIEEEQKDEEVGDSENEPSNDKGQETGNTAAEQKDEHPGDGMNERTIFVGNLPLDTTRKSLAALFRSCGKIESTRLRSVATIGVKLPPERAGDQNLMKKVCANTAKVDKDAKSTAQGYVVFCSAESVPKALALNNTLVNNIYLRVDHATPTMDASRSVFVGNLPYHADEASLQAHFCKECGLNSRTDVEGVRIVRDKETMQCKGFGYVLFQDKSMVATALRKMPNSRPYMKRALRVVVCGKRFKGRHKKKNENEQNKRRSFEGKRAETGAAKRISNKKGSNTTKKHRARGQVKKTAPHQAGVSKRAAAQAKAGKRVKQIQKRISKGMGKARR